ncbi:site-2 protease family protein [Deferribacterales bacterium RsTz2092]|nr:peptidase M50 [Deferribacterales bacterium]
MNFDLNSIVRDISIVALPFLFAITIHEASHAYAANALGDNTAKNEGRLTLNPLVHIDIIGLLVLFLTRMIGWAKPVPVDMNVVGRRRYGRLIVAAAGPLSNLAVAIVSTLLIPLLFYFLDDVKFSSVMGWLYLTLVASVNINITLAVLNLMPLLPLDGGRILCDLLPLKYATEYAKMERIGMVVVLALFMTGIISYIISPPIHFLQSVLQYIVSSLMRLLS